MRQVVWIIFFLAVSFSGLKGQKTKESSIRISGGRSFSGFEASIPEAGSDISSVYTTSSALINLSITSYGYYSISVQKVDENWDNSLSFYIRRTSNGISNGWRGNYIQGGTNFVQLSGFTQTLFEGRFSRYNIPIQYEFRNLSVLIPADDYRSSVIYTITSL